MQLRGRSLVLLAGALAMAFAWAADAAEGPATFVPWRVLNPGEEPAHGDLILHWIPASRDDMRRSPLLTSRVLASYASQCVAMQVIRPDDVIMIAKLGAAGRLPAAVITDGQTNVVDRVFGTSGMLPTSDVEKLVRNTFAKFDGDTDRLLDAAKSSLNAGDSDSAAEMYRKVISEKCLFPRKGREAEKALRKIAAH